MEERADLSPTSRLAEEERALVARGYRVRTRSLERHYLFEVEPSGTGNARVYLTCLSNYPESPPRVRAEVDGQEVEYPSRLLPRWSPDNRLVDVADEAFREISAIPLPVDPAEPAEDVEPVPAGRRRSWLPLARILAGIAATVVALAVAGALILSNGIDLGGGNPTATPPLASGAQTTFVPGAGSPGAARGAASPSPATAGKAGPATSPAPISAPSPPAAAPAGSPPAVTASPSPVASPPTTASLSVCDRAFADLDREIEQLGPGADTARRGLHVVPLSADEVEACRRHPRFSGVAGSFDLFVLSSVAPAGGQLRLWMRPDQGDGGGGVPVLTHSNPTLGTGAATGLPPGPYRIEFDQCPPTLEDCRARATLPPGGGLLVRVTAGLPATPSLSPTSGPSPNPTRAGG